MVGSVLVLGGIPLKAWREHAALSQRDLAKKSGVALSTIIRIESGEVARPSTRRRLADAFEVTPAQLQAGPPREAK